QPLNTCIPASTQCNVTIAQSTSTQSTGTVALGACANPPVAGQNCVQFTSTPSGVAGFQVSGQITGGSSTVVGTNVQVIVPVVNSAGAAQGQQTVLCPVVSTGLANCNTFVSGVFPQLGGSVQII